MEEKKRTRVLWISNVPPIPLTSNGTYAGGGWLSGAYDSIKGDGAIELAMAFPIKHSEKRREGVADGVPFYGFSYLGYPDVDVCTPLQRTSLRKQIGKILEAVQPDILHVFGSELVHSRLAVELFGKPERTIIHIQGMPSIYAKHCLLGFPFFIRHLVLPHSLLRGTLHGKARIWRRAGKHEIAAIQQVHYIMGRTEWDEACTKAINPTVNYVHCGETLRSAFYEESVKWTQDEVEKYSIYYSQNHSQVKGLHLVLPILPELIRRYPDVHLYIGGRSPIGSNSLKSLIRRKPLGWYLAHQIKKYSLQDHVTFIGVQNAEQVAQNLKRAHVFLSASLIENSPNSVGEAQVVGTPVVSSDVGGVKDFIEHGKSGFIYPLDEPYMIPYYIGKIFDDEVLASNLSEAGRISARVAYSAEENGKALLDMYRIINISKRNQG